MPTYARLKKLAGKENDRIVEVLRYIAKNEGYLSCGNVQYRKLYYEVLRDWFVKASQKDIFRGRVVTVSIKQYRRLRKYIRGKFSINTAVYLMGLYDIMLSYQKKAGFTPCDDNDTYTEYVASLLLSEIRIIIHPANRNTDYIDPVDYEFFSEMYEDFINLDNNIGGNKFKIHNNLW